jgi:hypothetical protein
MRFIRVLCFTTIAVTAVSAVIVASSASAGNIVCRLGSGTQGPCPTGYESYTGLISGLSFGDTFSSSFVTVKCHASLSGSLDIQGSSSSNARGAIQWYSLLGCSNNIGCSKTTVTASALSWAIEVLTAAVHIFKPLVSFSMECAFVGKVTCIYTANKVSPVLENHSAFKFDATLTANKLALTRELLSSGSCSETATWSSAQDLSPSGLSVFSI